MIEVYKILHNKYDSNAVGLNLNLSNIVHTSDVIKTFFQDQDQDQDFKILSRPRPRLCISRPRPFYDVY